MVSESLRQIGLGEEEELVGTPCLMHSTPAGEPLRVINLEGSRVGLLWKQSICLQIRPQETAVWRPPLSDAKCVKNCLRKVFFEHIIFHCISIRYPLEYNS